jgi:hypothetical protein
MKGGGIYMKPCIIKPPHIMIRLCIILFLLIGRLPGAEPPTALEEYIQFLREHAGYERFLGVRDDLRQRLNQDFDGVLIRRLLDEPDLKGIAFTNFDTAPEQFQFLALAAFIDDDPQWSRDGGMAYTPSGVPDELIKRLPPQGWIDTQSLQLTLEDRKQRKAIAASLYQLSRDMEKFPESKEKFVKGAKEKILDIRKNPENYLNEKTRPALKSISTDNEQVSVSPNSRGNQKAEVNESPHVDSRKGIMVFFAILIGLISSSWVVIRYWRKI